MTIDWKFIESLEGRGVTTAYVPRDADGKPLDRSGVTIASGVDLGQRSADAIEAWNLESGLTGRLSACAGKTGDAAVAELEAHPLTVSEAEVHAIDACVRAEFEHRVAQRWNSDIDAAANGASSWEQLDNRRQTVVMSVAWQYGTPWRRCPKFWSAATAGRWDAVAAELRDFGDRYPTRRRKEAEFLEEI